MRRRHSSPIVDRLSGTAPLLGSRIPLVSFIQTLAVAEHLSFRHTANVFGVAQSAVSRRIKLLEEDLGLLLFERSTQGVRLTEAGRHFVERVSAAVDELDHAVTKYASERVGARLATLWGLDFISLRLSLVFGPWERDTGVRDTLSAPAQIMIAMAEGRPASLSRPGKRDWIDARDVADAVLAVATASKRPARAVYNILTGRAWSALDFGRELARMRPGFVCRLVETGEAPTIDLHSGVDRPALTTDRLRADYCWTARPGMAESAAALFDWHSHHTEAGRL